MLWIGLTGGMASGKSTVSNIFREKGFSVLDADQLAREVVAPGTPGLQSLVGVFGPEILASGSLDRKKLGQLVFTDPLKRRTLEGLIHPLIQSKAQEWRREQEAQGCSLAIYDVPLLYELHLCGEFDQTIVVWCSPGTQRRRLMERDHISEEEARLRLAAQLPLDEKRQWADIVFENEIQWGVLRDPENLRNQVEAQIEKWTHV